MYKKYYAFKEFLKENNALENFERSLKKQPLGENIDNYIERSKKSFVAENMLEAGFVWFYDEKSYDYWRNLNAAWKRYLSNNFK